MTAHPPAWAQALLSTVVSARNHDSILGDLAEEYREHQLPAQGRTAADRWYVRQVGVFVWRACRTWGLMLGALLVARDVMDIVMPASDYYVRSSVSTYLAFSVFAAAAIQAAWQSARQISGVVVCLGAAVIASVIGLTTPVALTVLLWSATHRSPGAAALREAWDVPVPVLLGMAVVIGSLAGGLGKGLTRMKAGWQPSIRP